MHTHICKCLTYFQFIPFFIFPTSFYYLRFKMLYFLFPLFNNFINFQVSLILFWHSASNISFSNVNVIFLSLNINFQAVLQNFYSRQNLAIVPHFRLRDASLYSFTRDFEYKFTSSELNIVFCSRLVIICRHQTLKKTCDLLIFSEASLLILGCRVLQLTGLSNYQRP